MKSNGMTDLAQLRDAELSLELCEQYTADNSPWGVPAYRFHIRALEKNARVGRVSLRLGDNEITRYSGHVGYEVYPEYRGNGYARKATLLIARLAKAHTMTRVTLIVNPHNAPSIRVIEGLGAEFEGELAVPEHLHHIFPEGGRVKRVYRLLL